MSTPALWGGVFAVSLWALVAAGQSPLLAWRDGVYIAAGFAGIFALIALVVQPLLARRLLPRALHRRGAGLHRVVGALLVGAVVLHVAALWRTSPPDVVDALLLRSPTPFSIYGVLAMWALFAAAALAALRRRLRPRLWRGAHRVLVSIATLGTIAHALLIEGSMGQWSKAALCLCAATALWVVWRPLPVQRP